MEMSYNTLINHYISYLQLKLKLVEGNNYTFMEAVKDVYELSSIKEEMCTILSTLLNSYFPTFEKLLEVEKGKVKLLELDECLNIALEIIVEGISDGYVTDVSSGVYITIMPDYTVKCYARPDAIERVVQFLSEKIEVQTLEY